MLGTWVGAVLGSLLPRFVCAAAWLALLCCLSSPLPGELALRPAWLHFCSCRRCGAVGVDAWFLFVGEKGVMVRATHPNR